jgi:hypothetical protein
MEDKDDVLSTGVRKSVLPARVRAREPVSYVFKAVCSDCIWTELSDEIQPFSQ